jgi:hypothetical protein
MSFTKHIFEQYRTEQCKYVYVQIKNMHQKKVGKAGIELGYFTLASMLISHAKHLSTNSYRWHRGTKSSPFLLPWNQVARPEKAINFN